jgi:hypothetical protein
MDHHEEKPMVSQSAGRPLETPTPPQEKDFSVEHAETSTAPQLEADLINQVQHEDLEPDLHWR